MGADLHKAPESLFWYWISERHAIYLRRQRGLPKPWTDDPILRDYKFTNPFRENDRGTVWLRENFLEPHDIDPDKVMSHDVGCVYRRGDALVNCDCAVRFNLAHLAFNICWYRMFNWWGTGELLGWQTTWDAEFIKEVLTRHLCNGNQVFTGAHIVYSPPGMPKVDAIVDVCSDLYHMCHAGGALVTCAREDRSLQAVFNALREVHCVGGFMAYEMVTDMRHTRLLRDAKDIMTWANLGPGARRGLMRLGMPYKPESAALNSMRELLARAHYDLPRLHDIILSDVLPGFELRDIEHSLCEFDKYCRVKFSEGEPRAKFNGR